MSMVTAHLDRAAHDNISSKPLGAFSFANSLTFRKRYRKVNLGIGTGPSKHHVILGRRHLIECLLARLYQRAGWYLLLRPTFYPGVICVYPQAEPVLHTYP